MKTGLNTNEVNERIALYGYNELPSEKPKDVFEIAKEVIQEPMFILLIACGILYIILGDLNQGLFLLSTIIIIIFITFYQYQKTEKALNSLKNLSSPRALVIRNGQEIRIPGREVVPDDVVILNEGDRVPADGILIKAVNLTIDESILTGESVPVFKSFEHDTANKISTLVYSGTLVVQGKGYVKIRSIGLHTAFGKIGSSIINIEPQETQLQKEMKAFIIKLFLIGAMISVLVVGVFYFVRGNFIQSLLYGLAAAMAILPEEFPVVLTIFLALGAWRLSQKNVLTRKSSAIETLGAATVLCSDKTGTITQNKMDVGLVYNGHETILKNAFVDKKSSVSEILNLAYLASQENSIDPMEKAFKIAHFFVNENSDATLELLKEYPISNTLLAMTRVLKCTQNNKMTIASKGAPEAIFELCKLDIETTEKYFHVVEAFAEEGYRVIAVANAIQTTSILPASQNDFDFVFQGLIGLKDPIRPEVPQAIKECHDAGVKVIMITGDFPTTAKSVAKQAGMKVDRLMTGNDLNLLNDEELKKIISTVNIFARILPEQKLRIVRALQANNEIVAMTGDGVNDAPALKAANIGIAMGSKGTDVAREASSLVLLDDNFASIVSAIRLGRKIYDNLQKAMSYILAIHIPIIGLTLLPAFFSSLPILLMPLHIVILELTIDPICSVAFENEQEEENIMRRKPRNSQKKFFGGNKILESVLQGILLLAMTAIIYFYSIYEGHTNEEVRAIAFSSLVIGNIFLILTNLSKTRNFIQVITEKNWTVWVILSITIIILLAVITIPFFQHILNFQFPGNKHFLPSIFGASSILLIFEIIKYFKNRKTINVGS
jgi:Ca2+-transporting ATPase